MNTKYKRDEVMIGVMGTGYNLHDQTLMQISLNENGLNVEPLTL